MVIATTWRARHRYVSGLTVDPASNTVLIAWSADSSFTGQMPWGVPEYPTLLIYGIGVDMTTSGVAGTRRLNLQIDQPASGGITRYVSSGTQTAGLTRRWEPAVGFALETTLAGDVYREPLPAGFMLLPGLVGASEAQLTVSINGAQAGDVLGPVSIRGILLYP